MPISAAALAPSGRFLYVGTGDDELRGVSRFDRLIAYDLAQGHHVGECQLDEPFSHLAISPDGRYLVGSAPGTRTLNVPNASTDTTEASLPLIGTPRFVTVPSETVN